MDTALSTIEALTCLYLKAETSERTYAVRDGYSTVYLDPFTTITSVQANGSDIEYAPAFNGNKNAELRNSIIITISSKVKEVVVNATWVVPEDLQALITKLDKVSTTNATSRVKSKKIEDFSVTFNDKTDVEQFVDDNRSVINKYSICNEIDVRSGKIRCSC